MSLIATALRISSAFLILACVYTEAIAQDRRGEPNNLTQGYYVVDSDDNVGQPWQPIYNFIDTTFSPSSWKRVKSGPRQGAAAGYFLYNPTGWGNINQMDTTDNAMAGPMPLGFRFNFYDANYDSVYISSNGFIGFRPYEEAAGNPLGGQNSYMASQNRDFSSSGSFGSGPRAIIAAMWADLTSFRGDSTRIYVRTSPSNDTFMVNYYNLRMKPALPNVGPFTSNGGDRIGIRKMQIILVKGDSSVHINYGIFFGAVNLFPPVLAWRLFQNNSSIGVVNQSRNLATSVLYRNVWHATNPWCGSCNRDFRQAGGWALKFKQWKNVVRATKIDFPTSNSEICLDNSAVVKATVRNLQSTSQSFQASVTIRNAVKGNILYTEKVNVNNLTGLKDTTLTFPSFVSDAGNPDHVGRLTITAIAIPLTPNNVSLGDMWPMDDTVVSTVFGLRRLTAPFRDVSTNYGLVSGTPIPDPQLWVSLGGEVVDGNERTFDPPAPRDLDSSGFGPLQFKAPLIKLDRKNVNGVPYLAGGDTLSTFPINLQGATQANVSFNYQRGGRLGYPMHFDADVLYGPEGAVLNTNGGVVRTGDSLVLEFKKPTEPGCNVSASGWTRVAALDGGKDLEFKSVLLRVEDFATNYFTPDFRVRLRLKTKYDGAVIPPANDDEDPWYIDNFTVQVPQSRDLQVVWTRVVTSYTKVPVAHSSFPVYVNVINHTRSTAHDMPIVVQIHDPAEGTKYYEVGRFTILPGDTVLRMPDWNARNAKDADGREYLVHAWVGVSGYDSYTQDNGTHSYFYLNAESEGSVTQEFAYDDAGLNPQPNDGNDWPMVVQRTSQGIGFNNMSGSFAVKFNLLRTDTLYGVRIYFAGANSSPDAIRISVLDGTANGATPGDSVKVSGAASAFIDERKGSFYNQFWTYLFPKPLVLPGPNHGDDGYYWLSVSQLSLDNMVLGGDISRGGAELIVQDNTNPVGRLVYSSPYGTQYASNSNAGDITKRLAVETGAGSKNWSPMSAKAVGGPLIGTVIPMIRPLVSRVGILPVEFEQQLRAEEQEGKALLTWTTANEQNNRGFFVERMSGDTWEKIGFTESKMTNSSTPVGYSFLDGNVDVGTHSYRLIQMDLDGTESLSNIAEVQIGESGLSNRPHGGFILREGYPNPFDPANGSLRFSIESSQQLQVEMFIFNALGQVVRSLGIQSLTSQWTEMLWNGKDDNGALLPEGIYFIQAIAGDKSARIKVHLVR